MSTGLIMPILAIGGIVILGNYLTKKTKKHKQTKNPLKKIYTP